MAKTKSKPNERVALDFHRTGNPWIDAGIIGLYRVLKGRPNYVKNAPGWDVVLPGAAEYQAVTAELQHERLTVGGPVEQVQACLEKAYDRLVACYYDISSKNQEED